MTTWVGTKLTAAFTSLKTFADGLATKLGNTYTSMKDWAGKKLTTAFTKFSTFTDDLATKLGNTYSSVKDWAGKTLKSAFSGMGTFLTKTLPDKIKALTRAAAVAAGIKPRRQGPPSRKPSTFRTPQAQPPRAVPKGPLAGAARAAARIPDALGKAAAGSGVGGAMRATAAFAGDQTRRAMEVLGKYPMLKWAAKRLPWVGPILMGADSIDILSDPKTRKSEKIKKIGKLFGSLLGATKFAAIGAMLGGAFTGPAALVAVPLGAVLGALVGNFGGGYAGEQLAGFLMGGNCLLYTSDAADE